MGGINIKYSEHINYEDSVNWNIRDEYKGKTFEQLLQICNNDALPFGVCAISVTGELNIGMMLRSAALLGANQFLIFGRRKFDRRSAVGSQNYIDLQRYDAMDQQCQIDGKFIVDKIRLLGYSPVVVEGPNDYQTPVDVRQMDWRAYVKHHPCFIFGSESNGIPGSVLENCDMITCVEQLGVLRSFNVSAAAAIVMYEVSSQLRGK